MEHYNADKTGFAFLNNTKEYGLIFWRRELHLDLPEANLPTCPLFFATQRPYTDPFPTPCPLWLFRLGLGF